MASRPWSAMSEGQSQPSSQGPVPQSPPWPGHPASPPPSLLPGEQGSSCRPGHLSQSCGPWKTAWLYSEGSCRLYHGWRGGTGRSPSPCTRLGHLLSLQQLPAPPSPPGKFPEHLCRVRLRPPSVTFLSPHPPQTRGHRISLISSSEPSTRLLSEHKNSIRSSPMLPSALENTDPAESGNGGSAPLSHLKPATDLSAPSLHTAGPAALATTSSALRRSQALCQLPGAPSHPFPASVIPLTPPGHAHPSPGPESTPEPVLFLQPEGPSEVLREQGAQPQKHHPASGPKHSSAQGQATCPAPDLGCPCTKAVGRPPSRQAGGKMNPLAEGPLLASRPCSRLPRSLCSCGGPGGSSRQNVSSRERLCPGSPLPDPHSVLASRAGGGFGAPSERFYPSHRVREGSQTGPSGVVYIPGARTLWGTVLAGQTEGWGIPQRGRPSGLSADRPGAQEAGLRLHLLTPTVFCLQQRPGLSVRPGVSSPASHTLLLQEAALLRLQAGLQGTGRRGCESLPETPPEPRRRRPASRDAGRSRARAGARPRGGLRAPRAARPPRGPAPAPGPPAAAGRTHRSASVVRAAHKGAGGRAPAARRPRAPMAGPPRPAAAAALSSPLNPCGPGGAATPEPRPRGERTPRSPGRAGRTPRSPGRAGSGRPGAPAARGGRPGAPAARGAEARGEDAPEPRPRGERRRAEPRSPGRAGKDAPEPRPRAAPPRTARRASPRPPGLPGASRAHSGSSPSRSLPRALR
ncbi:collagen alpha-1(III) chain-like [Moschus berezovskii]|uniref:collagen alpha-1(III) chain-like n=1 Tax=Moschus berezovskii TaxID=68408 RepID=UPI0024443A1B|nr:collagen alpha-1(III) chain-like [Moschus berezovskii]